MESPKRLRFRDLRSKTLVFKTRIAIISCVLEASLGARACDQVLCIQKTQRFAFAFLSPLSTHFWYPSLLLFKKLSSRFPKFLNSSNSGKYR